VPGAEQADQHLGLPPHVIVDEHDVRAVVPHGSPQDVLAGLANMRAAGRLDRDAADSADGQGRYGALPGGMEGEIRPHVLHRHAEAKKHLGQVSGGEGHLQQRSDAGALLFEFLRGKPLLVQLAILDKIT
jgi:hypothetical protein